MRIEIPEGLTEEETVAYILAIMAQLEDVFIVDEDGNETPAPLVPLTAEG